VAKKIRSAIIEIISWLSLIALVLCIGALMITKFSGGVPQILGYRVFVISTGSMMPELEVGDVILSKSFSMGDELEIRDILTYEGSGDLEGMLITHRLVEISESTDESRTLVLQGDANNVADNPITEDRVVGKVVCKLKVFGFIFRVMQSKIGIPILIAIIIFFIIKETIDFSKNLKAEKKNGEEKKEE